MPEVLKPLHHHDAEHTDDETLRRDARAHLAKWPQLQFVAELLTKLRTLALPWWDPTFLREMWPPLTRMRWLYQRADIRQRITTTLTGLPRNASRQKAPDFQAELIDAVLVHGDVTDAAFDETFHPSELVTYGNVTEFWTQFRDRMPWEDDSGVHQKLVGWIFRALLADRSSIDPDMPRRPLLTPCDIRMAIDSIVWHHRIPIEVRAAIDDARFRQERTRPRDPYHARHDFVIATPEIVASQIPLLDLLPVFQAAERALGLDGSVTSAEMPKFELPPVSVPMQSRVPSVSSERMEQRYGSDRPTPSSRLEERTDRVSIPSSPRLEIADPVAS
ncbi:MAG: hypothetical protein WCI05_05920 [Myxococcales bacterium]